MAKQLKLALLSAHSCPVGNLGSKDTGGMNVYVREIARQLGRQGHLVDVYTRIHDPNDSQVIGLGQNARLIHLKAGRIGDIHKLVLYIYLTEFACNLENFRRENDLHYDLLFSHYWLSGWAGKCLQYWWDVPHMIMLHTLGAVKNTLGIGEDEPELRVETERYLVNDCHRIIASTEKEKEQLRVCYGASRQSISVIPCGVNLELFQPVNQALAKRHLGLSSGKIILFVGRVEPLKGIDSLLKAVTYLKNGQGLKLLIIGGDAHSRDELERLRKITQDLQIQDSVAFLGLVKQEELPYFYSAADVCVIPSYYESFGLIALESLACGTPVVATKVGGMEHIIHQGETGYIVEDNTPDKLADKISLLLARPSGDDKAVSSMRASVARFDWSNITEMVAEECRRVIADYHARVS